MYRRRLWAVRRRNEYNQSNRQYEGQQCKRDRGKGETEIPRFRLNRVRGSALSSLYYTESHTQLDSNVIHLYLLYKILVIVFKCQQFADV